VADVYARQVSLGHAAFFGLGAYSAALLGTRWGVSPWIGLLVGAGLATAFGILLGFLSNRLRGPYFVLATIAFSQVLLIVASRWRRFPRRFRMHPRPLSAGILDARYHGQARLGRHRPRVRGRPVPGRALPRALAPRL